MKFWKDDRTVRIESDFPQTITLHDALNEIERLPSEEAVLATFNGPLPDGGVVTAFIGFQNNQDELLQLMRPKADGWWAEVTVRAQNAVFSVEGLTTAEAKELVRKMFATETK